jgi:hypothetical protein
MMKEIDPRDEEWRGKAPGPNVEPPHGDVEGRDAPRPKKEDVTLSRLTIDKLKGVYQV